MSEDEDAPRFRLTGDDARLFGCCVAGGVLLAVMTGPPGTTAEPTLGFKGSLHPSHLVPYLVFGIALWVIMTLSRKLRAGELASVARARASAATWARETWDAALHRTATRWAFGGVLLVVALVIGLLVADLTGPYHVDKVSIAALGRQFHFSYTYGYLMFAVILWWLSWRRVLERHGVWGAPTPRTGPLHAAGVVLACLAGGLVVTVTANPWLDPRFHSSDVALRAQGSTVFWQWPTYLFLLLSLVIAWRILYNQRHARAVRHEVATGRRFLTPQLSLAIYVVALFIAIEWPKFLPSYWQSLVGQGIGVFALLALGLNVVVGFAGLLDLGYVAFYAVGIYTAAFFTGSLPIHPPHVLSLFWITPIAIAAAMLVGVLLGLPTLRLRGDYLAIVTLGFGEIIFVTASNWQGVTNAALGTKRIPSFTFRFFHVHYEWLVANPMPYYYLVLAFIVVAIMVFSSLNNSRVGRRWAAIREDEVAAASVGVNPLKYKVMAFAIGASTAGFAGVFTASGVGYFFPAESSIGLQVSILILALVILGGMGSIFGVIIGAALYYWVFLYLQLHPFSGYDQADFYMYLGALFVLLMIFRPQGLFPARRRARELRLAEEGVGFADPIAAERGESDEFERPTSDEGTVAAMGPS
jgi:branched-chain amino acid transport system permease protein